MVKKLLTLLLFAGPVHAVCSGYANQRALTISTFSATVPQMVTNVFGTVNNFPVLVTTTSVIYSTAAGTGQLLNSNGYDLTYSADSSCNTMLNFDTETVIVAGIQSVYNAWVQVPTLSTATATAATIYQNWGNAAITSYVGHSTATWDSNYKLVLHLPNGSSLSANDSTSNANNGTLGGTTGTPTASFGVSDGGATFIAANNQSIITPSITNPVSFTVDGWAFNTTAGGAGNYPRIMENAYNTGFFLGFNVNANNGFQFIVSGDLAGPTAGGPVAGSTWYHVVGVYNGTTATLYINGVAAASKAESNTTIGSSPIYIGVVNPGLGGSGSSWGGNLDELRFSSVARNSDWILSEYNTVNSSSTFVSYGTIQTGGAAYIPQNRGLLIQGGKLKIQGGKLKIL